MLEARKCPSGPSRGGRGLPPAMFELLRRLAEQRRSLLLGGDDWLGAPLAVPEVCDRSDAWML